MTILIILALFALAVVYTVFFLLCKVGWLIFKSHSNKGPLITAGVCTVILSAFIVAGIWMGTRAILAPFQGLKERIAQNPNPVYGEHTYKDDRFPFELTVYDGMDFTDWITWGNVQFKLGIDTNAFKKGADKNTKENFLLAGLIRQTAIRDQDFFKKLESQLQAVQEQGKLSINSQERVQIDGKPAYQAQGEAYSNQGKMNFWLTAVQTEPNTVYYIAVVALKNFPQYQTQALGMGNSFRLLNN